MSAFMQAHPGLALAGEPAERLTPRGTVREVELIGIALRADSHLELDWLWFYMQLADPAHRRYCLLRALEINPHSAIARRELELLDPTA
ncbi:MAG TPA: hypothetical protein PKD53_20630 [Chloroflexaceae bacterium]|nr:hypothetical protein [Chloroflexaceae bacterium]